MTPRPTLVIMLKEPRPGRVKTRLGRDIGMVPAAWWFRHQTAKLIRRLARDPRWQTILAVAPDAEGLSSRIWPEDIPRIPQGVGTLGDRMARILREAHPGARLIIGADIPDITPAHIANAFAALGPADALLGPAPDGGYWSIGLAARQKCPPTLFQNVRWSTPHALSDTAASFPKNVRITFAETLSDIDTAQDLSRR